jgi:hypothetical protein
VVKAIRSSRAAAQKETLLILVSSDRHMDHVVNLTAAAHAKGKLVRLFFTGRGVLLTLKPEFKQLAGKADVCICGFSFHANGLQGREREVLDVTEADFTNQATNAALLADAHRHLVF